MKKLSIKNRRENTDILQIVIIRGVLLNENNKIEAKAKIQQVFSFIREITRLRTPPIAQFNSYSWSLKFSALPSFPTIQFPQYQDGFDADFDGAVLRIKRPTETQCPHPPEILNDWIETGWEQINKEPTLIHARNKKDKSNLVFTERFDADTQRINAFEAWIEKRRAWQEAEKPVRQAIQVFSSFFKLFGQLQRESEKYQLYIGDGHLVWESAIEPIDHPILLKKVELEFDSSVPEFILRESDESPELYTSLLRHHELDMNSILACKKQLEETESHPLGNDKTTDFLNFFIHRFFQEGRLYASCSEIKRSTPSIYRDPAVFLGIRAQGFTEALDKLIDSLPKSDSLPESLFRIVGFDEKINPLAKTSNLKSPSSPTINDEKEIDFLLTKPANKEQERVITRLSQTGSVLVQGPPGTGKSHTIANIIGHLLASGKTILVSSHTSKALKVVREKVALPLQPLCVSILDNDFESKSQLKDSINEIVSYLSRNDEKSLILEIEQLRVRRNQIKLQLEELSFKALEIRKGEYSDIIVAGEGTPPSEAARRLNEREATHGWIPSPMQAGAPPPLNSIELQELYATNKSLTFEDESCIAEGLPNLERILKPAELSDLTSNFQTLDKSLANRYAELWLNQSQNRTELDALSSDLGKALEIFSAHNWIKKVAEDSNLGSERLQPWKTLIELIETTTREVAKRSELILKFGPHCDAEVSPETIGACQDIIFHLQSGKSLNFFTTAFRSSWKVIITSSRIDDGAPSKPEHFEAILASLETLQMRRELTRRWERQVVTLGGPSLDSVEPEVFASTFLYALRLATDWSTSSWQTIESQLLKQGFNLKGASEKISLTSHVNSSIDQIQTLAEKLISPSIESRRIWIRLKELEKLRESTLHELRLNVYKVANAKMYLNRLIKAVDILDSTQYEDAFNTFIDLKSKYALFEKRQSLLKKMKHAAPAWAKAIELRTSIHGEENVPGDLIAAWTVCQWRQELERRINQDYSTVQRDLQRLKLELNEINAQYVEKLSWRGQLLRTGLREKQALSGWQQLQSKITKTGKGKRDVHVKREAMKTLKDCKNAVPVWVMPLSRVFENFDLVRTKFDVILLDEASQSDITALAAFAIAKQVIVVGDNEQVTPFAVGQEQDKVQSLIDEYLQGIPNRNLYDGKTSIYDLAEQAFGETIRLVEHFRSVPDIIEFSNQLSYGGEIRPLRE